MARLTVCQNGIFDPANIGYFEQEIRNLHDSPGNSECENESVKITMIKSFRIIQETSYDMSIQEKVAFYNDFVFGALQDENEDENGDATASMSERERVRRG
jgi:hypothetical protein